MSNTFYNEILISARYHHRSSGLRPLRRGLRPAAHACDDIWLKLKVENDEIVDGAFVGDGCAISQASADMMLDLIIGKKKDEALRLANLFLEMIKGTAKGDELEPLEEASILQDVSHMPARVKCAVLGWHTMEEMFKKAAEGKIIPGMSVTTENK